MQKAVHRRKKETRNLVIYMGYRTIGMRKVNGKRRKVSILHQAGKIVSVRIANRPHYTDKTAKKMGIAHKRGYVNNPNSAMRVNTHRRRSR
jgi:hypothetical protein